MSKAKFSLMEKKINLDTIEGKYSAFVRIPYALPIKMSKPIADNGYGTITVDGIEISKGKTFEMDLFKKTHCMLIPVGEVAREYGRTYTVAFSGFVADDGTSFPNQSFKFSTMERNDVDHTYTQHDAIAMQAAVEGMVLLKNDDNILPLAADSTLNIFGADQFIFRNTSTGASLINPRWQANFHQAIREHSTFSVNNEISDMYRLLKNVCPDEEQLKKAKAKSDIAIIVISRVSGEFLDNKPIKGQYYLSDEEERMIEAISSVFDKTIAVINTGYPIETGWISQYNIKGVIYTGYAGMCAGNALVELLDGRSNFSGRLSDTWSFDYYDNPSSKNFINFSENDKVPGEADKGVQLYYEEDIYVGYRYFLSFNKDTAYCFGHGLSYTSFSRDVEKIDDKQNIVLTVTNTGAVAGKDVVQVYIHAPENRLEKPSRVLAGFEKTKLLEPGESQKLVINLDKLNYASFDEEKDSYILEAGEYEIYLGASLDEAVLVGSFNISSEEILKTVNRINCPVEGFHRLTKSEPFVNEDSKLVNLNDRFKVKAQKKDIEPLPLEKKKSGRVLFTDIKKHPELIDDFVAQLTNAELCKLNVCGGANWYLPWQNGCAGKTNVIKKYKMPQILVSDGNTGVNIKKRNIGFPCSTNMAATFNKELAYKVGKVIGEESIENGITINLGPGMNIHRNILNGRHPEYYSEDPYLAGTMAGMHGKGLISSGVGCTYKHLFCNNSDTSRKGSHSIVSVRALREIYYRVFEVAFSIQKPTCLMTSYNAVNGIYPAENPEVLQTLIRDEWKFDGLIMTDWGTYDTVDPVEMVKAGNCWLTEGSRKYQKILLDALKSGRLTRNYLERNVKYLIMTMIRGAVKNEKKTGI